MPDTSTILNFVSKALPWIGAAATGNVPALIGLAANAVGGVIGSKVEANAGAITAAIAGATPEQIMALKQADAELQVKLQALGFQQVKDLRELEIKEEALYVQDTQSARASFAHEDGVFWLGVITLGVFAVLLGGMLWGCYQILSDGIQVREPGVVAVVFSLIGTIVGYVASAAQQVYGYFFGSSKGSADKTVALGEAVKGISAAVK